MFWPSTFHKRLGLLRAQKNGLVVADGHLLGLSLEARPKTSWKSHTLTRTCTLLA
jgi:hypothetical protein